SSGQPGLTGAYPAAANTAAHRSQLLGSSQRPWMNTTGLRPESLACAICADREIAEGAVELLMATSLVDSGRLIIRNPTYVAARSSPPSSPVRKLSLAGWRAGGGRRPGRRRNQRHCR